MSPDLIESKDDLIGYFADGEKPKTQWRVGTEHEKFPYHRKDLSPLPYEGPHSVTSLMEAFGAMGWRLEREHGHPIAAFSDDGRSFTLEPGGQIELSGAPLETVHETCREITAYHADLDRMAKTWDVGFIGLGFHPFAAVSDMPKVPKDRYTIMRSYMPKVGSRGLDMMHRTCTVQANLDYASEQDCVKKFRTATALQPLATALFASSPFVDGAPNGFASNRAAVWLDTDRQRSGFAPGVFDKSFGYEAYAEFALDVPMYFVKRDGAYIDCSGQSFRDFMAGKLPALPGEKPTTKDWADHISTIFTEVRLKTYLEMRGADSGMRDALCALPALWVGLLYDEDSLDAAHGLVLSLGEQFWRDLAQEVPHIALSGRVHQRSVAELALEVVRLADQGLARRNRLNAEGLTEQFYLNHLHARAVAGEAPSDILRARWEGEWGQDFAPLFADGAY